MSETITEKRYCWIKPILKGEITIKNMVKVTKAEAKFSRGLENYQEFSVKFLKRARLADTSTFFYN